MDGAGIDELDELLDTEPISDAELAAEAMAADPDAPIDPEAVPFGGVSESMPLLPQWYMPAPSLRRSRGRVVVLSVIAASLAIGNVVGLCVTSGFPEFVFG